MPGYIDKKRFLFPVLILLLCFFSHVFTFRWELPAWSEHVADTIYPSITATVMDMFRAKAGVYPPFHFAVCNLLAPGWSGDISACPDALALQSSRIAAFRLIAAGMLAGIALILYSLCQSMLGMDRKKAFFASALFALLPVNLYYSHTSNMEIPYTFWYAVSIFCACAAYKAEAVNRQVSLLWNFACGAAIACAFCTKDQVAALYVLPALYYVFLRFRETKKFLSAIRPLIFWCFAFLPVTLLIYRTTIGFDGLRMHLGYIFADGKNDYLAVTPTIPGFLRLILDHLRHFACVLDGPVLVLLAVLLILSRRSLSSFAKSHKTELIFFLLTDLSLLLLFLFPVLRSEVRWHLPLCLWVCPLLFQLMPEKNHRLAAVLTGVLFAAQCTVAVQFLFLLQDSPLTHFREYARTKVTGQGRRLAVPSASFGKFFYFQGENFVSKKAVRNWAVSSYALEGCPFHEIYPDLSGCLWTAADAVPLKEQNLADKEFLADFSRHYEQEAVFTPQILIPTLFPFRPDTVTLFRRSAPVKSMADSQFARRPLEEQLMLLTFLMENAPAGNPAAPALLVDVLNRCDVSALNGCHISKNAAMFAADQLDARGRTADAACLRKFGNDIK